MSHTVKIEREFKDLDTLRRALEKLGWTLQENSKIRTYPSDNLRNTVYPWIAKNPLKGYDLGIRQAGEKLEIFGDFFDRSISQQLGNNLDTLAVEYAKSSIEKLYSLEYDIAYEVTNDDVTKVVLTKLT